MVEKQGWQASRYFSPGGLAGQKCWQANSSGRQQFWKASSSGRPTVLADKQAGRNIRQAGPAGMQGRQAGGAGWPAELADQQV